MAKTKCVICKMYNVKAEIAKHPNVMTVSTYRMLWESLIVKRDSKVIATICEEHRNPLKFNVSISDLAKTGDAMIKAAEAGNWLASPTTLYQIQKICGAKI